MTNELKILDRSRKRELFRKGKSDKWKSLNAKFEEKESALKINYYSNIVQDLKESDSGQWYSKIKRMSGQGKDQNDRIVVEEIMELDDEEQAEAIADHYAAISNEYEPLKEEDIPKELYEPSLPPPTV